MAETGPKKMNWWYQSIIEWMIENPDAYLYECAQAMGVTQAWLSVIINSDAFQTAYREARGEHFSNTSHTVVGKMQGIALQSAELIARKLDLEGEDMPLGQLQSTAELALKALGYTGGHGGPAVHVNVQNRVGVEVAVDRDLLAQSRERMRQLEQSHTVDLPSTTPQAVRLGSDSHNPPREREVGEPQYVLDLAVPATS